MSASRWALVLVALLALAAGLKQLWRAPPAPRPDVAPEALPLPWPTPASAPASAPAPRPPPGATATPPRPAAAPGAVAAPSPRIGSEGYGPHIDGALAGNDPARAWEAVHWLRQCASNEQRRASFERAREQGVAPSMMTQLMLETDADARRCQTVTPQHQALMGELSLRALRGGVPEAAAAYAAATNPAGVPPALRLEVAEAMRRDARAGHAASLLGALMAPEGWGLGDDEKLAYLQAYGEMTGAQGRAVVDRLVEQRIVRWRAPPTPEQTAAAQAAARQIVGNARAGAGRP
jgi:hypothetical protein